MVDPIKELGKVDIDHPPQAFCNVLAGGLYGSISVRQASALPAASFRFHLAVDTLAVRLIVPLAGPIEDFHLQVAIQPP
ncbi:MAG: hypothetical protein U1D97_08935 [Desulfuromonadales bacterium]|nr:hypothetical protein [Desulfuromonadales bacterium]